MQMPKSLAKVLGAVLAVLTALLNLFPSNLLSLGDKQTAPLLEKTGGFIAGVCHPQPDFELLRDAGLEWIRVDLPYLYAEDGSGEINPYYEYWKQAAMQYVEAGFKIFAVTPYPYYYELISGLDIRDEADIPAIQDIARYYASDLQGIVSAIQITNEMGVDRFTGDVTMEEAARFIGVQAQAMNDVKGDIIVGYNLGGMGFFKLPQKMKKYNEYIDYVGADLYFGSFENFVKNIDLTFVALNLVRMVTGKPIIVTEFGYIGRGQPKTAEEKTAILQKYGFNSEEEARADIDTFISRLPEKMRDEFTSLYGGRSDQEKGDLLFKGEYANHIYCELSEGTYLYGYPHNGEGQAKFFTKVLNRLLKIKWCAGAVIYMWNDTGTCYVCGQSDCPVETGWGLVDGEGNPKPAYYAVKEVLTGVR